MKHAGDAALDQLEPLLADLRALPGLIEKKRGVFYRRSRAFLHFHEDPKGLFADVRNSHDDDFERIEVSGADGRATLLAAVELRLRA